MFLLIKKITPPNVKRLVGLFMIFAALCVLSGGCGGTSGSVVGNKNSSNVNDIWNGGWIYQSGSASSTMQGQEITFKVLQIAMFFENSSVSEDKGSSTLSAVFCVSSDKAPVEGMYLLIPSLFDKEKVTTERTDDYTWTATTDHGTFEIDINPDTLVANVKGSTTNNTGDNPTNISLDIVMKKVESGHTVDVDNVLKGTWQTATITDMNMSGGLISTGSSINGVAIMNGGTMTAVFESVDIANKEAHLTTTAMAMAKAVLTSSNNTSSDLVLPLIVSSDIEVSNIFGSIYKFNISRDYQPTKGIIIIEPEDQTKATLVINSVTANGQTAMNAMFHLTKVENDIDIQTLAANKNWIAKTDFYQRSAGGIFYSQDMNVPLAPIEMSENAPFEVSLDVNFTAKQVTVSADGDFIVSGTSLIVNVGDLLKRLTGGN